MACLLAIETSPKVLRSTRFEYVGFSGWRHGRSDLARARSIARDLPVQVIQCPKRLVMLFLPGLDVSLRLGTGRKASPARSASAACHHLLLTGMLVSKI
jgi:hypothetical protein